MEQKDWADSLYNVELHGELCCFMSACCREECTVNTGTVLSSGGGLCAHSCMNTLIQCSKVRAQTKAVGYCVMSVDNISSDIAASLFACCFRGSPERIISISFFPSAASSSVTPIKFESLLSPPCSCLFYSRFLQGGLTPLLLLCLRPTVAQFSPTSC